MTSRFTKECDGVGESTERVVERRKKGDRFVNSRMIVEKYVRENLEWNFTGMSQQLRIDTNVDATIWQY
ncbi:hypothetical protein Ddye_011798 [Dipteronia dyeriana]|uniref:Uncharacterized protein n=1 Tax=Dipteronia dyeriana TaxID=168575 RepID=A0AAE0CHN2_9ROSI|nr:hypothetical protein Ddye_011798 [Dipteronia dyeriana]